MKNDPDTQEDFKARVEQQLERRRQREDINQMVDLRLVHCDILERSVELTHSMSDWETNVYGTMHGGLIALVLDAAMANTCRAWTGDQATPTLDIHVNFIRPVRQGALVHAKAWVIRAGRSTVQLRSELWTDTPDHTCATADAIFFRAD